MTAATLMPGSASKGRPRSMPKPPIDRFKSIDRLRDGVEDYIHYGNNDHIRLKLKGLSPVQHRPSL